MGAVTREPFFGFADRAVIDVLVWTFVDGQERRRRQRRIYHSMRDPNVWKAPSRVGDQPKARITNKGEWLGNKR